MAKRWPFRHETVTIRAVRLLRMVSARVASRARVERIGLDTILSIGLSVGGLAAGALLAIFLASGFDGGPRSSPRVGEVVTPAVQAGLHVP